MGAARIRQCVILVGGAGTRLGDIARDLPKPLLPVGDRPFVEWLLMKAARKGFSKVLLLAGHKSEQVFGYLSGGIAERLGINIDVSVEPSPLGTGGALVPAKDRLDDVFVLLNGDTWFDFDWTALSIDDRFDVMLSLRPLAKADRYETVRLEGGRVTALLPRDASTASALINGGSYVLRRSVVDAMVAPASLEHDILPRLCAASRLGGQIFDAPFIDIGIPADYAAAQTMITAPDQ